eukprot:1159392-Pelagomonas_calceolata.AAC.5
MHTSRAVACHLAACPGNTSVQAPPTHTSDSANKGNAAPDAGTRDERSNCMSDSSGHPDMTGAALSTCSPVHGLPPHAQTVGSLAGLLRLHCRCESLV